MNKELDLNTQLALEYGLLDENVTVQQKIDEGWKYASEHYISEFVSGIDTIHHKINKKAALKEHITEEWSYALKYASFLHADMALDYQEEFMNLLCALVLYKTR